MTNTFGQLGSQVTQPGSFRLGSNQTAEQISPATTQGASLSISGGGTDTQSFTGSSGASLGISGSGGTPTVPLSAGAVLSISGSSAGAFASASANATVSGLGGLQVPDTSTAILTIFGQALWTDVSAASIGISGAPFSAAGDTSGASLGISSTATSSPPAAGAGASLGISSAIVTGPVPEQAGASVSVGGLSRPTGAEVEKALVSISGTIDAIPAVNAGSVLGILAGAVPAMPGAVSEAFLGVSAGVVTGPVPEQAGASVSVGGLSQSTVPLGTTSLLTITGVATGAAPSGAGAVLHLLGVGAVAVPDYGAFLSISGAGVWSYIPQQQASLQISALGTPLNVIAAGSRLIVVATAPTVFFALTDSANLSLSSWAYGIPAVPDTSTASLGLAGAALPRVPESALSFLVIGAVSEDETAGASGAVLIVGALSVFGPVPVGAGAQLALGAGAQDQVLVGIVGAVLVLAAAARMGAEGTSAASLSVTPGVVEGSLVYLQTALVLIYEVVGGVAFTQPGSIAGSVLSIGSTSVAALNPPVASRWRRMSPQRRTMEDYGVARTMLKV